MVEKKKRSSKIAIVLSLALAAAALTPANVQAAKVPKKTVFYLSHKYNEYDTFYSESASFSISELKKSEYIKISSLKSSDESVVEATTVHGDYYFEKGSENRGWCSIACNYKKPGTAVVSYKTGNKKRKTKVIVKDYENPIKSITLDGVNGGKDFSDLTEDSSYVYEGYPTKNFTVKSQKKPVLTIEPASGWLIVSLDLSMNDSHESYSYYNGKGVKGKQKYSLYEIGNSENASLYISMKNKDGGTISLRYDFNN